jgi:hypothetical protein
MSEQSGNTDPVECVSADQAATSPRLVATDIQDKHMKHICPQVTMFTETDVIISDSSEEDDDLDECNYDLSEYDLDNDERFNCESTISLFSKTSSSTKPVSSKSVSSHQSTYTTSSTAGDEKDGTAAEDMKCLRDQLYQSLEDEKALLVTQQKLLAQMEEVEHSIIRAEHEERIARVESQQAYLMNLLDKATHDEETVDIRKS